MSEVTEIWRHAFLHQLHTRQREILRRKVPALSACVHDYYLSLSQYFSDSPQRFFSERALRYYHEFLEERHRQQPSLLRKCLRQNAAGLSQAFFFLREINSYNWHDQFESLDEYEELRFVDSHVHPTYLRVLEGVYYPFIHVLAYVSRTDRGKSTEGLDLYNAVQELGSSTVLAHPYRHIIRNGIAHGGVTFLQRKIEYRDKGGKTEVLSTSEVVRLCDDLLDTCNALAFAASQFYLAHGTEGYTVPQQVLIDELRAETNSPWWHVVGCIPSRIPGRTQLLIYARSNTRDVFKVHYHTFLTAVLAELLAPGYDRYFFSLKSKRALPGFAAFDGLRLKKIRESSPQSMGDYEGVLENNMFFYVPRFKLPRFLGKIDTYLHSARIHWPLIAGDLRRQLGRPEIVVRTASIHRNGFFAVLKGSVLVRGPDDEVDKDTVRKACRAIVARARSRAHKSENRLNIVRLLPLGWARIAVFRRDYRKRRLLAFGLGADLVCTVQVQTLSRIRAPDIAGSTIESRGRYRIAWNRAWLDEQGGQCTSSVTAPAVP